MKKFKIDRAKFIYWALRDEAVFKACMQDLKIDLAYSGEFILTAQEVLDIVTYVPGEFAINQKDILGGQSVNDPVELSPDECEFVYVPTVSNNTYVLVTWPDSQAYMDKPWFNDEAIFVNDADGVGSSAYMIPSNRV